MDALNKFTLRLPVKIDRQLQEDARSKRRSKTQQVIAILEEHYKQNKQAAQPAAQVA